jgi:hypothetical protein
VDDGGKADKSQAASLSHHFAPLAKITAKLRLTINGFAQVLQKCHDSVHLLENLR